MRHPAEYYYSYTWGCALPYLVATAQGPRPVCLHPASTRTTWGPALSSATRRLRRSCSPWVLAPFSRMILGDGLTQRPRCSHGAPGHRHQLGHVCTPQRAHPPGSPPAYPVLPGLWLILFSAGGRSIRKRYSGPSRGRFGVGSGAARGRHTTRAAQGEHGAHKMSFVHLGQGTA